MQSFIWHTHAHPNAYAYANECTYTHERKNTHSQTHALIRKYEYIHNKLIICTHKHTCTRTNCAIGEQKFWFFKILII